MGVEKSPRGRGRPLKYKPLLALLDDETCYIPALIAELCFQHKLQRLFLSENGKMVTPKILRHRIRMTLGHFARNHRFPKEGDGLVLISGQPTLPGWFGWRWKEAAGIPTQKREIE